MKKRILVVSLLLILVVSISTFVLLQNNKVKYDQNKNITPSAEKNKNPNKKTPVDDNKETSEEKKDKKSEKNSSYNNNVSSYKKECKYETQPTVSKEDNTVKTTPQPQTTPQPTQQVPSRPKTEWEILGITEYEYYNTPLFDWEEVSYKNMSDCQNEAKSINQKYGFVTNYGDTSGKYVNTIGCWVEVYVNGKGYYLNEFRALGY